MVLGRGLTSLFGLGDDTLDILGEDSGVEELLVPLVNLSFGILTLGVYLANFCSHGQYFLSYFRKTGPCCLSESSCRSASKAGPGTRDNP